MIFEPFLMKTSRLYVYYILGTIICFPECNLCLKAPSNLEFKSHQYDLSFITFYLLQGTPFKSEANWILSTYDFPLDITWTSIHFKKKIIEAYWTSIYNFLSYNFLKQLKKEKKKDVSFWSKHNQLLTTQHFFIIPKKNQIKNLLLFIFKKFLL